MAPYAPHERQFKALMPPDKQSVERLEALLAEQSALRRVATLVAVDPEPRRLFDSVCLELGRVLGVDSTDMLRYEQDGTATVVGAWTASGAPSFPVGTSVPVEGQTVTAKLYRSGRPERVDDYSRVGGELAARLRASGIRSAVGAPIKVAGRLWGAIMVVADRPHAFPDDIGQRIARFAELVTAALANADARQQLAASRARIVEAGYEERRRLERDLHDGAQQRLVSLGMQIRRTQRSLPKDARILDPALDKIVDEVSAAIADLRQIAAGVRPARLDDG